MASGRLDFVGDQTATLDVENPGPGASRERVELLLEKARLALRAGACVFSLVAFVVMACNKNFDEYEEYRWVRYWAQVLRQLVHQFTAGREVMSKTTFVCDQVVAYLLMSALSAAIPMTNRKWEKADNSFTESSAAAISMTFFAFVALALSALISGFKLSNQFYI
ncbi:hypothetical protein QJS10_CPA03g01033 [Acorus calamus]|uniref:CASP-like protein n=1 Tax=Acorus calamus TaxID=4465 RepID=A0AAV9FAM5_ACOCL|nr:hypothetical protein QJS10_CPA03g01033 [Acorus calamus]